MTEHFPETLAAYSPYTVFRSTAAKYPDHDFLHIPAQACRKYSENSLTLSYSMGLAAIDEYATAYATAGLSSGDRVVLVLENRPDFFLHHLALNSLGVCTIPIHHDSSVDEMAYLIDKGEACAAICLREHAEKVEEAIGRAGAGIPSVSPDQLSILSVSGRKGSASAPSLDSPAAILFTSGTTGNPKGCVLSNRYFLAWGRLYTGLGGVVSLRPGKERLITPLPTNHTNALGCSFMGMISSGGCIVQVDRFSSSNWWQTVRDSRATIMHYLGVMPAMLLNLPADARDNFSTQLRFGFGGGVDPKHHKAFEERFGFPLVEGWAMTELGGGACIMAQEEPRHIGERCIGRPPENIEIRLVDEAGEDVAAGEPGELLLRTVGENPRDGLFSGYYSDEKSTAAAWLGGYFHTGDVMCQGEDGSLFFVDRRKNIIRRSGENISAAEVEEALLAQSAVAVCAVAAVPDEFREEEVMGLLVLAEGFEADRKLAETIFLECLDTLSYFKVPGHIGFVDQLPISSTQKIKQGEIKGLCKEVFGTPSHFDLTQFKSAHK